MNTPTPRTDAAVSESIVKVHETSLQLETELTAALAEIDRLDVAGIHSCHANCQKSMCVMRRELTAVTKQRDELKNKLEKSKCYKNVMKRDNAELRKQRDRLAESLEQLMSYQPRATVMTTNERHVWSNAKDALQSLTTNKL